MEAGNLEQLFERIRTARPNALDLSDVELAMLAAWLQAYRAPQLRLSQLRDEKRRGIRTYRDELDAEKEWVRHMRFVLGYNQMRRTTAPVPVDGNGPPAAQAHSDTKQYPNSVGPEPGVTWRQYVDEQHRHMEACAPPGWEGLLAHDQPRTFADVGPWLRRELASLLLMGEKSHDEFWLERANELLRNAYRLLDMFKVWGAPQQQKTVNDPNEIERAIRSLAEWCQEHEEAQSQTRQAQQSPRIVGVADARREDQCKVAKPSSGSPATRAKPSTAKGEAQVKIIAALTNHHQYNAGGCMNLDPIGVNRLADAANVGSGSVTRFFKSAFEGGHVAYRRLCLDSGKFAIWMESLNGDLRPFHHFGRNPPNEPDNEDEE